MKYKISWAALLTALMGRFAYAILFLSFTVGYIPMNILYHGDNLIVLREHIAYEAPVIAFEDSWI